jgi:two-component system cell cycle response regulator DivK
VEDNIVNADMLSRRLERRGYAVVLATDGLDAVSSAKMEQPDLILMDMSLPEIDGWKATRRIRRDASTSPNPVIALTAHALSCDREGGLEAGCDDFETKPVDFNRLIDKIRTLAGPRPPGS